MTGAQSDNATGAEREVGAEIDLADMRASIPDGVWGPVDDAGSR